MNHREPFNLNLIEYTSYADTSTILVHYVLYWKLGFNKVALTIPLFVFEDCCVSVEESLNSMYHQGRVSDKSIGPLESKEGRKIRGVFNPLVDWDTSASRYMSLSYSSKRIQNPISITVT